MLTGLVIAWAIAVPILTSCSPPEGVDLATHTPRSGAQVRFIGAGAIGVAAIYTLARLAKPVVGGLASTLSASRAAGTRDTDRDLAPQWIILLTVACLVVAAWLSFARSTVLAPGR